MEQEHKIERVGWGFGGCDMRCKQCYNASVLQSEQHDFATLKTIADKLAADGVKEINYGTGEFIFNANALALARYLKEQYPLIRQAVTTNGATIILLEPIEIARLFNDIDISIDFPNPEEHNRFRQHPMAWSFVERSLRILTEIGMERSIVTCVTSETKDHHVKEFLELAKRFGAAWRINWFRNTGRGKEYLRISAKRAWQILKLLTDENVLFESLSDPLFAPLVSRPEKNPSPGCVCGKLSCRIQTDLRVTPCVFLKGAWAGGSIKDKTLAELYESEPFRALRERLPNFCVQSGCEALETCRGGCASRAVLHSGQLSLPDDYCPYFQNEPEKSETLALVESVRANIKFIDKPKTKVHDGYLCTVIVKP
ncbi:radical SAM protein [Candidatus Falkowbacteria bacterium]|nr:radical SAM protein [Candidatus Falkowbacteria bacterium]